MNSCLQHIELSHMFSHTALNFSAQCHQNTVTTISMALALLCLLGEKMSDNLNVSKGKNGEDD